jgi:GGDEF domain-containing protein
LVQAAEAWRAELRPGDELARIGGEEFAVLLPGSDPKGAAAVLGRFSTRIPRAPSHPLPGPGNALAGGRRALVYVVR